MAAKDSTNQFYNDIKSCFFQWKEKKENGIQIYTDEVILARVAARFYRSPKTIENIVFDRVK